MRYAIVIEKGPVNNSACVPDFAGMRGDGLPTPEPSSQVVYVEVAA